MMYAKNTPRGGRPVPSSAPRFPSYQQPSRGASSGALSGVSPGVPPGYSGYAAAAPTAPQEPAPIPYFDDLPRVSRLGEVQPPAADADETPAAEEPAPEPTAGAVGGPLASRFPFGHGLGREELLILGLILFLLYESPEGGGRSDLDETVILLAALLFMG